ncbi:3'-5' exoribonuclease [Ereboglobus sp. PH5-10]|uniref:3'-5' exoribonuclease YhaM family protein n=1 Tax=Ereboglobus sp. PH5-10 TaxID=2940629 RepID=UPI0024076EFB|nr:HD domain-containing protein [Ereboglobus sp. PH5-10]MDF9827650.1 3'-5' exoribonuclease [Ereboglobus sp. PH5-10]
MPDSPQLTVRDLRSQDTPSGAPFTGTYILKRCTAKTASNGNPFLSIEVGDRTGSFNANLFADHPQFDTTRSLAEGSPVCIEGRVDHFNGRLSPRILKLTPLTEEELVQNPDLLENLVETPPENADALWAEFQSYIDSIAHDELRMTVRGVFEEIGDAFRASAAAVAMHHAYRHGLLEHTTHMARAAKALFPVYPEVNPDLAMAGILLHDTGKTIEYEGAFATRRSRKGILQGHVVLGYQIARKHGLKARLNADLLERLEHIILSHQGEPEWGAAIYAATPEAVFVSMVDNLDAKMGMVQRTLRQATPDDEFSERLPGLNSQLLVTPPLINVTTSTPPAP